MKPCTTVCSENSRPAFVIAVLVMMIVSSLNAFSTPIRPPNLIIILTDAQGYHDVGFNGCQDIPTPNLDSIASKGVCFTSGYVSSPLSSPSRAGILTGRYQERFEYEHNPEWQPNLAGSGLPLTESTLADVLGKVGYKTGVIGKWHLGCDPESHPLRRGFDEFFGFLGAGHDYFPEELTIDATSKAKTDDESWHLWIQRNYAPAKSTNYLTDEFSDEAVRFIARNQGQPFFLLLAYNAPQVPLEAPDKYLDRFTKILSPRRRTYAAMVSAVDDGVGNILAELHKDALADQTLVVYLSASGGALDANSSDNYPLRGFRNNLYEGGWRVPFAMQWPGHLPAGMVYGQPVLSLDIFATITALANVPTAPQRPLDGVDLLPYLTGLKAGPPHETIYIRTPEKGACAVRSGDYKLVIPGANQAPELYNLTSDIAESKNVADARPEVVRALRQKLAIWNNQMRFPDATDNTQSLPSHPIDIEAGESKTEP